MERCVNCGIGLDISGKTLNYWHPFCSQNCYWSWLVKGREDGYK